MEYLMPFYDSADQLYTCIGALFERVLLESPEAGQGILAARMLIRMRCTDPAAEIVLNGRQSPIKTGYGRSSIRPDLEVELAGDTLHGILLDELSIKEALASSLLRVKGPIWKTSALVALLNGGRAMYGQVLQEHGLSL